MRKRLVLGKIDYDGRGRKINEVDIEYELTSDGRFTASGNIWNSRHTDIISGGQNLEEIAKLFPGDERAQRIVKVWRKWHLNDMKAGTPKQEKAVVTWKAKGNRYDYDKVVTHLKGIGLYEDDGYKYGTAWLKEELPPDVVTEIEAWSGFPQGEVNTKAERKKVKKVLRKVKSKSRSKRSSPGISSSRR